MRLEANTKEIFLIQERIDDLQAFESKRVSFGFCEIGNKYGERSFITEMVRRNVSSQKLGVEKIDHLDEFRPEAPSFPDDQRSQTTLPRIIEKGNSDYWSEDMYLDHIRERNTIIKG